MAGGPLRWGFLFVRLCGCSGYRCVVPVVSCVCWSVAVFIVAHLGVRGVSVWRLGVLLRCVVGVALFGRCVVRRIVPGSQLVGFRRGVLLFLVGVVCRGGLCGPWGVC